MSLTYRDAGVDIDAGDALVERIKPHARPTLRPEVLAGIGGFGGLFALDVKKYREPVLVSGTDGVGTKLKVAFAAGRHDTVGIDLVAMCVNDVAVVGRRAALLPRLLRHRQARGRRRRAQVVKGIAEGCRAGGLRALGGETAELPGFYARRRVRPRRLRGRRRGALAASSTGRAIAPGDAVIGVASTGLHSNGYSLARKVLLDARPRSTARSTRSGAALGEALLEPTRIYVEGRARAAGRRCRCKGFAHITGGGLPGNLAALPPGRHPARSSRSGAGRARRSST